MKVNFTSVAKKIHKNQTVCIVEHIPLHSIMIYFALTFKFCSFFTTSPEVCTFVCFFDHVFVCIFISTFVQMQMFSYMFVHSFMSKLSVYVFSCTVYFFCRRKLYCLGSHLFRWVLLIIIFKDSKSDGSQYVMSPKRPIQKLVNPNIMLKY